MPGRKYSTTSGYRYGFNGKEKDNEGNGEGNAYDYGDRIYNPRIGRWLSIDRMQRKYPNESPYAFVSGNPIIYNDPDGKDKILRIYAIDKNGLKFKVSEQVVKKGVYNQGQGDNGFFFRRDIIDEVTIDFSGNKINERRTYGKKQEYAFETSRSVNNLFSKIGAFIDENTSGNGSFQNAGYSFSGGSGSTLELRDKAGNYLGNIDLGTLFSFFNAANLTGEGVKTLFKTLGNKNTLEKIALFGEKVKTLMEAGETIAEATEHTQALFEKVAFKGLEESKMKYDQEPGTSVHVRGDPAGQNRTVLTSTTLQCCETAPAKPKDTIPKN